MSAQHFQNHHTVEDNGVPILIIEVIDCIRDTLIILAFSFFKKDKKKDNDSDEVRTRASLR